MWEQERKKCERQRDRKTKSALWGKSRSDRIMGNSYSSEFSFRSLSGYNTRELSIVKVLKTDGFIWRKKKKKQRWGKCNYPARSVREFYCLIIIPQRHVKLFLSYLFKTPRRHRSGEEVTRLQQGTRREKDVREMCRVVGQPRSTIGNKTIYHKAAQLWRQVIVLLSHTNASSCNGFHKSKCWIFVETTCLFSDEASKHGALEMDDWNIW